MHLEDDWRYPTFCMFFILFGLTLVSGVFNLLVFRFILLNKEYTNVNELESWQSPRATRSARTRDSDALQTADSPAEPLGTEQSALESGAPILETDNVSICSCTCYKFLDEDTM